MNDQTLYSTKVPRPITSYVGIALLTLMPAGLLYLAIDDFVRSKGFGALVWAAIVCAAAGVGWFFHIGMRYGATIAVSGSSFRIGRWSASIDRLGRPYPITVSKSFVSSFRLRRGPNAIGARRFLGDFRVAKKIMVIPVESERSWAIALPDVDDIVRAINAARATNGSSK